MLKSSRNQDGAAGTDANLEAHYEENGGPIAAHPFVRFDSSSCLQ